MAQKSKIGDGVAPITSFERAQKMAQQEADENIAAAKRAEQEAAATGEEQTSKTTTSKRTASMRLDLSELMSERKKRVTCTFTLSPETDLAIDEAAQKLKMKRSVIIETAFKAWWEVVQKNI